MLSVAIVLVAVVVPVVPVMMMMMMMVMVLNLVRKQHGRVGAFANDLLGVAVLFVHR